MTKTSEQMALGFEHRHVPRAQNLRKMAIAETRVGVALELEALYLDPELSEADIVTGLSAWIKENKERNGQ